MNKRTIIIIIILIVLIGIGVVLYLTGRQPAQYASLTIATIWDAPAAPGSGEQLDFNKADRRVQKGRSGFEKGLKDASGDLTVDEVQIPEGESLREMVMNVVNLFTERDILLTVGATTDEATMDASMEMNFFNVPMLIPFADGMLSPDDSPAEYSMRMHPTAGLYDDYLDRIFSRDLFTFLSEYMFRSGPMPEIDVKLVVFYTDNFNGNDTAVRVTQSIMDSGYNIEAYVPFTDLWTSVDSYWNSFPDKLSSADAVIIIGEDANPFPDLAAVWSEWADRGLFPYFYLIGYLPQEPLDEEIANADNVFAVQPKIDMSSCPDSINNRSEALGYASGIITGKVLNNAVKMQPPEPTGIWNWFRSPERRQELHNEYISAFRSNIRSAFMDLDEDIPCYGKANFRSGPDERVTLELVHYTDLDKYVVVSENTFVLHMMEKIQEEYGITD